MQEAHIYSRRLVLPILYITVAMNSEPPMKAQKMTPQQVRSNNNVSSTDSLISRINRLRESADWWNRWYLILGAAAVVSAAVIGGTAAYFQYTAVNKARLLADAEAELGRIKEKDKDLEIATLKKSASELDKVANEARERAGKTEERAALAESHLAEAQKETAVARREAAQANAKAEGFRLDIAKANERAAEATRVAESERLARVQLEARLAPRTLTADQQKQLIAMLAPFAKTGVVVIRFGDTQEVQNIGNILASCLKTAGWTVNLSTALGGGGSVTGIVIGVRTNSDEKTHRAAKMLTSGLITIGLSAGPWNFEQMPVDRIARIGDVGGADEPIRVFIGAKPQ